MIVLPTFACPTRYRLYRDSQDEGLIYVDTVQPLPVHREAVRWLSISDEQAYCVGEVQFAPRNTDLSQFSETAQTAGARSLTMPWQSGRVFAWYQREVGVQPLAEGETSGYGIHNTVLNGTAGPEAIAAPLAIAAELYCSGQLAGASLQGGGDWAAVHAALQALPLGDAAPPMATLADVLLVMLRQLVETKGLILLARAEALSLEAIAELKQLALMEWAHRIVDAWGQKLSLAMPAAQVAALEISHPINLELNWCAGEVIPMRAVRVLRTQGNCPAVQSSSSPSPMTVTLTVAGNWQSFDYVQLSLGNHPSLTDITLTPDNALRHCHVSPKDIQSVRAIAGVRGFGVKVPIETIQVAPQQITVILSPLVEKAFLVKVPRSLLEEIGPLKVDLSHPAMARVLVPRTGSLELAASHSDLTQVSAVYRALLWQDQQAEPFQVAVQPPHGGVVRWSARVEHDTLLISEAQLPRLRVLAMPLTSDSSVTVELAQIERGTAQRSSLGQQTLAAQETATWVYPPEAENFWLRSRYPLPAEVAQHLSCSSPSGDTEAAYWTDWHPIDPKAAVMAPQVQQSKVVFLPTQDFRAIAISVAPVAGAGAILRGALTPGQATAIPFIHDSQNRSLRYRVQFSETAWSDWVVTDETVIKLSANALAR
jgi:hypothetical protein